MDKNQNEIHSFGIQVGESIGNWSAGCAIVSNRLLYPNDSIKKQQQEFNGIFPEVTGPELKWYAGTDPVTVANGGRPSSVIFEEAGILNRIRDLSQKKAGGVEPPAFITAKDMADELESLPKCIVEAALDPQETGEAEVFLEELKRQGEGFAVAVTREEEFTWNLMKMAMPLINDQDYQKKLQEYADNLIEITLSDPRIKFVNPLTPSLNLNWDESKSIMFATSEPHPSAGPIPETNPLFLNRVLDVAEEELKKAMEDFKKSPRNIKFIE